MNKIEGFQGEYRFLSNFWAASVEFDGLWYNSVEHAYQAAKTLNEEERRTIRKAETPGTAKRLGRTVTIRPDWNEVRLFIMEDLVRQKFSQEPARSQLLATGDDYLEETNRWNDTFWGVCNGTGQNHLGKILMKVRDNLK